MNDNVFYMRNCRICPHPKMAAMRTNLRLDLGEKIILTDVHSFSSANKKLFNYYDGRNNALTPTSFVTTPAIKNRFGKRNVGEATAIISVLNQKHIEIIMRILKGVYY